MKNIKEFIFARFYIIIPLISFLIWPFLLLYYYNFSPVPVDYHTFYTAGKYIFIDPEIVYTGALPTQMGFYYLPIFACVFSPLSLFEYKISMWIFFLILIIIYWLSTIELNKILILKGVNDKFSRFLILMVFSHGFRMWQMFNHLTVKWIVMLFIILFVRREIEKRKAGEKEFSFKFFFIQMNILFFAISMSPVLIFIIFIYIFNNVRFKTIFDKIQLHKYLLGIGAFVLQNFMFLFFPKMLYIYITRTSAYPFGLMRIDFNIWDVTHKEVIEDRVIFTKCSFPLMMQLLNLQNFVGFISLISIISFTILLCLKNNLSIEDKFGYFMLFSLFFNIFFIITRNLSIVIPFVILLFINKIQGLNNSKNFRSLINYLKNNYKFIIGLMTIVFINFYPEMHLLLRLIPILKIIPVPILALNWTFDYIILLIIIISLRKNGLSKDIEEI